MVKVSIIVPVYNVEDYLDKCLNSLVHQSLGDIQIIIVNDGSRDNSCAIIENYKAKYEKKITYIEKTNGGLSDARNTGLKYAIGEYIGCIDGDDYADVTMFEKMYKKAKEGDYDLVECDYYHVYDKKKIPKIGKIYESQDIMAMARVSAWNKIIKREILEDNKIIYPIGLQYEDLEYFYKVIPYINKIGFVKEPLYYYLQRENSICHIYNERTTDIFIILDNIIDYYKEKKIYEKYEKQLEYTSAKHLLGGSFFRIVRISDRKIRKRILLENWQKLIMYFPYWKKNYILKKSNSLLDLFLKSQNRFSYQFYSNIFYITFWIIGRKNSHKND
jgi:glycosyltransferase involved in cell wall biosynthesis